jgi:mannose-6-phosphate isomerase-like protein (cupin superfamily)
MRAEPGETLRIALQDAGEHLARVPEAFVTMFKRGDLSVELFAPHDVDTQQPHEQDEIYVVTAGAGVFRRGADRVPFGPGDFLFVAAGVSHAFETFTNDFKTWVFFFGPKGGHKGGDR